MAKIIKLENIYPTGELVDEYVCGGCRHLVGRDDKVCWQCEERLTQSTLIEHYHRGVKLSNDEFNKAKRMR